MAKIDSKAALMDASLRSLIAGADNGDPDATLKVHSALAHHLRENTLSDFMRETLAGMHESIARGIPADVAMLTKPPTGRPSRNQRDWHLYLYIVMGMSRYTIFEVNREDLLPHVGEIGPKPTMSKFYADAAKQFGVSKKTAKAIYLKIKNRDKSKAQ